MNKLTLSTINRSIFCRSKNEKKNIQNKTLVDKNIFFVLLYTNLPDGYFFIQLCFLFYIFSYLLGFCVAEELFNQINDNTWIFFENL